jgi:hypothetical protein
VSFLYSLVKDMPQRSKIFFAFPSKKEKIFLFIAISRPPAGKIWGLGQKKGPVAKLSDPQPHAK